MTKEALVAENNTDEKIKVYEVGYLLLPIIEESNIQAEANSIRDIIEKNKGVFISEEAPQLRSLTYTMTKAVSGKKQKFGEAYFGWIKFDATSSVMKNIKESLDKSENILRFILINTVRENITVANSKVGKFSFDKEKVDDKKKKEVKGDEDGVIKEKDEEELDNTIDELVIE